jgi:hypothetical protein
LARRIEEAAHEAAEATLDVFAGAAVGAAGMATGATPFIEDRADAVGYSLDGIEGCLCLREQRRIDPRQTITQGCSLVDRQIVGAQVPATHPATAAHNKS